MSKTFLSVFLFLSFIGKANCQSDYLTDSLMRDLQKAATPAEKVEASSNLADRYFVFNNDSSNKYRLQALKIAELSRNRKLIIGVYLRNGQRCLNSANGLSGNYRMAEENFQQSLEMARANGMNEEMAYSYIGLAEACRQTNAFDKSREYSNLALGISGSLPEDSLKVLANIAVADDYFAHREKLLAFRSYLNAADIAEASHKDALLRVAYRDLGYFYLALKDYDKSIDQFMKILAIDEKNGDRFNKMQDYKRLAGTFSEKKQTDIALELFEHCISLGDSLKITIYNLDSYFGIANMYYTNDELDKGKDFIIHHRDLAILLDKAGISFFFDEMFAKGFMDGGQPDSALYFLKKAEPIVARNAAPANQFDFDILFGKYYSMKGACKEAISWFQKARELGLRSGDLNELETSAQYLDTLYEKSGDYRAALNYERQYNYYHDSLQVLSRQTDMLKLEMDNDNRHRERLAREEEENTEHRHNTQYMGFTAGLAGLFFVLVLMGFFVVSPKTIRALGFISFIFLFEFIIMLADKRIHEWTHGEPWKILGIKILLAAILLPLHHQLEHKVIHFLTSRRKLASPGISLRQRFFPQGKPASAAVTQQDGEHEI